MKILAIICFSAMFQIKLKTKDQIECLKVYLNILQQFQKKNKKRTNNQKNFFIYFV